MKTKENGENIYKMLNAWLRNSKKYPCVNEKRNKGYKERETGRKMLGEQLNSF